MIIQLEDHDIARIQEIARQCSESVIALKSECALAYGKYGFHKYNYDDDPNSAILITAYPSKGSPTLRCQDNGMCRVDGEIWNVFSYAYYNHAKELSDKAKKAADLVRTARIVTLEDELVKLRAEIEDRSCQVAISRLTITHNADFCNDYDITVVYPGHPDLGFTGLAHSVEELQTAIHHYYGENVGHSDNPLTDCPLCRNVAEKSLKTVS